MYTDTEHSLRSAYKGTSTERILGKREKRAPEEECLKFSSVVLHNLSLYLLLLISSIANKFVRFFKPLGMGGFASLYV